MDGEDNKVSIVHGHHVASDSDTAYRGVSYLHEHLNHQEARVFFDQARGCMARPILRIITAVIMS